MTLELKNRILTVCFMLMALLLASPLAHAKSDGPSSDGKRRYIVELQDPPLAEYRREVLSVLSGDRGRVPDINSGSKSGASKLDISAPDALIYLEYIAERHREFTAEASLHLGRQIGAVFRYRIAVNGMAVELSQAEAELLADSPMVKSLAPDTRSRLQTFAGPQWLGADELWSGSATFSEHRGEGIVVGSIDSGINWEHPSFVNPAVDGYVHVNPRGTYFGLCNEPLSTAQCNDKLIGIYDFVEDDPSTEDIVEGPNDGRDDDGHGSHTAGTAVGNAASTFFNGYNVTPSGVAPRANLVSYRVCHLGDCFGSAIIKAIDQAIVNGVDVINYSIGSAASNPWSNGSISRAFLNARDAGIVVVTSAGNEGPNEETIGSPANAPWAIAVGYATHNVTSGSLVEDLAGGDTTPPGDLIGASNTDGISQRKIVHARDYGYALCGTGEAELQAGCSQNLGLSNPWDGEKPFNGEIVVCDRGTYGRVEKGKNLQLAGAGGFILANTDEFGESVVADNHCLPASHIGEQDGDKLRSWLASGSGHEGSLSGAALVEIDSFGDIVDVQSSRGPAEAPVEDILKPNLIAPGVSILAASDVGQSFRTLSGSSMSSPHVAGAVALLKSAHPDWSVSQLESAIKTTATAEQANDSGLGPASVQVRGAGRPVLGDAANAGLFLDVSTSQFLSANPSAGGEPGDLNLPGLVNADCQIECSFERTLTDQEGGGSWTAAAEGFADGVAVEVSPENFSVGNGQSRSLTVDIDLSQSGIVGEWVSGAIRLSSAGSPDQLLTVSVFSAGGDLPGTTTVSSDRDGGWQELELTGLVALPDATYSVGGLMSPETTTETLDQDPTFDNPYDGGEGTYTVWHEAPNGILWLYAETLASTSNDLDLFVGRDGNGDGFPQAFEELCSSTTPDDLELCELYDLPPGDYWIVVQNWEKGEAAGDQTSLLHAAVMPSADANFAATGPGIISAGESIPLRLSWNNVDALPGEQYFGAVGVGTHRETPNNVGIIPVRFNRTGIAPPQTFPLMNGSIHQLALAAGGTHDHLFIDVPPGSGQLTVEAGGADEAQNNGLVLELKRLEFAGALNPVPFAASPSNAPVLVSANGVGGIGPSITVIDPQPGRWYAVLTNTNGSHSKVKVRATAEFQGSPFAVQPGLWYPGSRPDVRQGYEYNVGGGASSQALVWYTYDEAGQPAWYIAGGPVSSTNIWTAELLRFTNDGAEQQGTKVGYISVSNLGENEQMFSYTLFGRSASERMVPIAAPGCPQGSMSYTGLWYPGFDGLGGASVLVNDQTQSQIHYLFDGAGAPRWLAAAELDISPTAPELPMLQFSGYCAVCEVDEITSRTVGVSERSFSSESQGSWTLDYLLRAPLSGSVERTDAIQKLTDRLDCQ